MPNNPRAGGVSRRIEGEDRDQMRQVMDELVIPDGMGAIVRTAGVGRAAAELQWDLDNLKSQWDQIDAATKDRPAPYLVYRESDAVTRSLARLPRPTTSAKCWSTTTPPSRRRRNT